MPRRFFRCSAFGPLSLLVFLLVASPLRAAKEPQGSAALDAPISAELEGAGDLKAPLDPLLLAARTVEVAADYSAANGAVNAAYSRSQAAYNNTYNSMASSGASNGQAMYAASQAQGIAAYGAMLDAAIAKMQAEARAR